MIKSTKICKHITRFKYHEHLPMLGENSLVLKECQMVSAELNGEVDSPHWRAAIVFFEFMTDMTTFINKYSTSLSKLTKRFIYLFIQLFLKFLLNFLFIYKTKVDYKIRIFFCIPINKIFSYDQKHLKNC